MSPSHKPLVTVVGASSKQGRSVAGTLLDSGRYRVRALTRDVGSAAAGTLKGRGAELVGVPLEPGHERSLVAAFEGAQAAFLMTPPTAPGDTREFDLGCELADAAVAAGVEHIVFSGLENVEEITTGAKFAPHFTDKARIENYIRTLPVRSSFVYLAFFYTNLFEYYIPRMDGDSLVFPIYLPEDFRAPFVDPTSATGPALLEILDHPMDYAGKSLPVIGEMISPGEMVETFTRVTGKAAKYASAYRRSELLHHFPQFGSNPLLVDELLGMAEYAVEYGYYRSGRDLLWSRRIDPGSVTWEQFLRRTGWQGEARSFGV
ncbi:NmrA/HSCARG family protein [Azospirillum sp. YIM B02556]|uniref:NmrA/HSCARG family protein n=1 Tax=Azospirillum endophyticum TaxID=2800326 RepID=A0ABS1FDI0_9PROT|nr:NmrA/HSCARG family protein [Azospirillum endophyticum]MBK1841490.1 NmrA/HSCARG family protein [Azospirillum endophyticum]